MAPLNLCGWLNLSPPLRPSYALVLEQAAGGEDQRLTVYRGVWMTAKRAKTLARNNGDSSCTTNLLSITVQKFEIMALPAEVGAMVLQQVALEFVGCTSSDLNIAVYLRGINGRVPTAIRLPPITQAGDRVLRLDSIVATIKLITFEIHSGPANAKLQTWLASLDLTGSVGKDILTGFDVVHSLKFPYFSRFPYTVFTTNNDVELMRRCAHLRYVTINFVYAGLLDHNGLAKPIAQICSNYRLDGKLTLVHLRELRIQGPTALNESNFALQGLKNWFDVCFTQRKQETKVVVEDY